MWLIWIGTNWFIVNSYCRRARRYEPPCMWPTSSAGSCERAICPALNLDSWRLRAAIWASLPGSHLCSGVTLQRSRPHWPTAGATGRPKDRSTGSRCSNAKCMAGLRSTCSNGGSSGRLDHQKGARAHSGLTNTGRFSGHTRAGKHCLMLGSISSQDFPLLAKDTYRSLAHPSNGCGRHVTQTTEAPSPARRLRGGDGQSPIKCGMACWSNGPSQVELSQCGSKTVDARQRLYYQGPSLAADVAMTRTPSPTRTKVMTQ